MMMRLTLVMRVTMIVLVGLAAIWIVLIGLFYRSSVATDEDARPAPARLAAIAELIERATPAERSLLLQAVASDHFTARIEVGVTADSTSRAPIDPALREDYSRSLGGRAFSLVAVIESPGGRWFPRLARELGKGLEFRIGLKTGDVLVVDTRSTLVATPLGLPVGFGAGLFGTVVALLALLVMQRETRPLARLAAAVDSVDLSGVPVPLPDVRRSAPEIRAVVTAFGRMQTRLAELLLARMALVGGVAHDVRTFATRLRLRADHIADAAERQRAITDIDDMIRLLDDAVLASRTGAGEFMQELIDLDALVRVEAEDRRAHGAAVDYIGLRETGSELAVLGDHLALRRIVANLIDNAIKYGGSAQIRVNRDADLAVLTIDDEGPGIPAERRLAMFEPFTRLDGSRSRKTGGAGLGLAIARTLVEAHGGTIEIGNAPRGARIVVRLPLFMRGSTA
jgi:signal transduction histidine kinase